MNYAKLVGVAAAALLSVAGCSKPNPRPDPGPNAAPAQTTESATRDFRAHCARREYDQVYASAAPEFRSAASQDIFVAMMRTISNKLGRWESAKDLGEKKVQGQDAEVMLGYQSRFANGDATEQFVWRRDGEKVLLVGYHIHSPTLGI